MIYVTGDTHGDFSRFFHVEFADPNSLSRDDYVIICGDFGGIWLGDERDNERIGELEELPFTVLFVSGNHENFEALAKYPIVEWNSGKAQFIRPNVIHLMRGQVFNIESHTFFTMGGAASHDISGGILELDDPEFEMKYWLLRRNRALFRINHLTWWKEEMPSDDEYEEAIRQKAQYKRWYFGHYHDNLDIGKHSMLYEAIVQLN